MLRSTKKVFDEILKNQREIKESLDPKTLQKSRKYDEMCETLRDFKLTVKSVKAYVDKEGRNAVHIVYEPVTEMVIVQDEEVVSSPRFRAINKLNLISFADMRKISAAIEDQKKVK